MKFIKALLIVASLVIVGWLLIMKRAPVLKDPLNTVMAPGTYQSLPFNELQALMPRRFEYIRNNSTFLEPYDDSKMDMLADRITKVSGEQMLLMMVSTPNAGLGYYRVEPLKDTAALTSFQFEQGLIGWFWIYGTFLEPDGSTASYMYYIIRMDAFPPALRKELHLPMGSTTYYSISMGVGRNGRWTYSPYKICRGEYTIHPDQSFSFKGLDLPAGWDFQLSAPSKGHFDLKAYWKDDSLKQQGFTMGLQSLRPAFFNGVDGCLPCTGGSGTNYFSYTELETGGTMTLDDSVASYAQGTGWIDRQWANGQISTPYLSLLSNTVGMFREKTSGLGKYIWLNLHLGKDLQYMVWGIFPLDKEFTKGTKFNATQNRYGADKLEYRQEGEVEVLETNVVAGIEFPIKYKIQTADGSFILDATDFSQCVSLDISNNIHWDGSAIVYDSLGNVKGTGFLEANQFSDPNTYVVNSLMAMGLDTTSENKDYFKEVQKLSLKEGLPSLVALVITAIIIITLVVLLVKILKNDSTAA
jgi:hypothetical protein